MVLSDSFHRPDLRDHLKYDFGQKMAGISHIVHIFSLMTLTFAKYE